MARTSLTLLAAMPPVLDFTGEKIPAAGWYGHTKGQHTFALTVHNFQGRIALQGSQALSPTETDWFALPCPPPYDVLPYIQYPRPVPQRNPNLRNGETSTIGFSLHINCLWLRACVWRDYLLPVSLPSYAGTLSDSLSWLGAVDLILVNF